MMVLRVLWALPATVLGLGFAALALAGGRIRVIDGVIEAHGPAVRWALARCLPMSGIAAMTLGHVVLGRSQAALDSTRAHERVHVRQYERWGVLFLPAYLMASGYAVVTGGHYYHDNVFEREAVAGAKASTINSRCTI
jgi:hypothetical protein